MCMQHSHTSKHALFMNDNMKGSAYPSNLGKVELLRRSPVFAKPPSRVPCLMLKCAAHRTGVYHLVVSQSWSVMWLVKVQSCLHLDSRKCNFLLKSTWGLITDSLWSFASRFIKVLSVIDILEIFLFFSFFEDVTGWIKMLLFTITNFFKISLSSKMLCQF